MQNYAQIENIDFYSLHNIFQLLRNHRILQHINYSFLYLKVLVKPELSMHKYKTIFCCQNIHICDLL